MNKITLNFNYGIAALLVIFRNILNRAEDDTLQMSPRGMNATRIAADRALLDQLELMPPDSTLRGNVSIEVEIKKAARVSVEGRMSNLRTMGQDSVDSVDGMSQSTYNSIGFEDLDGLDEAGYLLKIQQIFVRTGDTDILDKTLSFGNNPTFRADTAEDIDHYKDSIMEVASDEARRHNGTEQRYLLANTCDKELGIFARTGKDVFLNTFPDPAKYANYVINPASHSSTDNILRVLVKELGTEAPVNTATYTSLNPILPEVFTSDVDGKIEVPYEAGTELALFQIAKTGYILYVSPNVTLTEGGILTYTVYLIPVDIEIPYRVISQATAANVSGALISFTLPVSTPSVTTNVEGLATGTVAGGTTSVQIQIVAAGFQPLNLTMGVAAGMGVYTISLEPLP